MKRQTIRRIRLFQTITTLILCLVLIIFIYTQFTIHHCNWPNCPHENMWFYTPRWEGEGFNSTEIGRIIEQVHFEHPHWSYEECTNESNRIYSAINSIK